MAGRLGGSTITAVRRGSDRCAHAGRQRSPECSIVVAYSRRLAVQVAIDLSCRYEPRCESPTSMAALRNSATVICLPKPSDVHSIVLANTLYCDGWSTSHNNWWMETGLRHVNMWAKCSSEERSKHFWGNFYWEFYRFFSCSEAIIEQLHDSTKRIWINECPFVFICRVRSWSRSLGSQPAGDIVTHEPGSRLSLLSAWPAVTFPAREHRRRLASTK